MPDILTPVYWTADMVRFLPEDALAKYLQDHPVGVVWTSPADISWGPDELMQPDVFVVPIKQARMLEWTAIRDVLLVAEVLSPSSPGNDRFVKRRRYQEARVPLYWIVDGDERQVEVWTPDDLFPRIERDWLAWQLGGVADPLTLSLQELFRAI